MKTVCICGGGALGHVVAGYLAHFQKAKVRLLTTRPESWRKNIKITLPEGSCIDGHLDDISSNPEDVIPGADTVLLCLPGFLIRQELIQIRDFLEPSAYVGCIFSSTGFFFEAMEILPHTQPLWGFQRVPFIARVREYGISASLLGYKSHYDIAVEHVGTDEAMMFVKWVENAFGRPVSLLKNYLEASLTNSNPILHTSRLYSLFSGWKKGRFFDHDILFYEEWDEKSSDLLIRMDDEFFSLLEVLPVRQGYLPRILDYYESHDAASLAEKLSHIKAFKGIYAPMQKEEEGWIPDFSNRYFTEDFPYGLKYIWQLGHEKGIAMPVIDKVFSWGMQIIGKNV